MIYKIKELMTVNRGSSPRPIIEYLSNSGFRWLKISDFNYRDKFVYNTKEYIKELKNTKYVKAGTLILTNSATPGIPIFLGKDMCLHDGFLYFTNIRDEVNINYIFYWFQNYRDSILNLANGSVFKNLKKEIVENLEIDLPSMDIQNKVVYILDNINNKINLNNKINNNLFEILKAYYKEHFIDNENKNMKKMCDLVKETIGGDWGKDKITDTYNQEVLCIRGADIPDMDRGNKGKIPKRFILEKNVEKKQLCGNEIVIEISGGSPTQSTGRCAYITEMLESSFELPIICTNFCRAIRLKDDKYLPSFYMNLKYLYEKNIMFLYENGTTGIKNLDLSSFLDNEEINIIEDEENQKFNNLYYNINNKMIKNAEENRILEQLRDTLLPKLMNGEINLDNIEI